MTKTNNNINYETAFAKLKGNKTSHHIGGLWMHIEWNGNTGTDQHGRTWRNRNNPECLSHPGLAEICSEAYNEINLYCQLRHSEIF